MITERGRLVYGKLDERGKSVTNFLTEQGRFVITAELPLTPNYYLSMDGIDDTLQTPALTCTKIIVELSAENDGSPDAYIDTVTGVGGWWYEPSTNDVQYDGIFTSVKKNGITQPPNGVSYVDNTKATYEVGLNATNIAFYIMESVWHDPSVRTKGKLYDIKFYNGTTLVAHYDMSKGTVVDQSGNGNHATLTGGTWVEDSPPSSGPPDITIISVNMDTISDEVGANQAAVKFSFTKDVTAWEVRVLGSGQGTGTLADSGGSALAGQELTAVIDWTELYQEGDNRINIYGQSTDGWTPYQP